jgi:oxygen-independent coproporphyrinogen-3 oxidase
LGVYVHWPYCARICPYCDFNVVRDRGGDQPAALAQAIIADLRAQAALLGPRRLVSLFFGGGTPSLMDPQWAAQIVDAARSLWPGDEAPEISLEANPTDAEAARFAGFAAAGVSRLSLGVQALDDAALRFLGRNHDAAAALRAVQVAANAFPRLSLDLIYALPGQTAHAWAQTLRAAADLGAEHVSPYQLTIEAGTAFDRAIRRGRFSPADPDLAAELYDVTQAVLQAQGFAAYEVSNHARGPAARSRHNLVYWRGEDYLGVGPGAHGRLTLQGARTATVTHLKIADYIAAVAERGVGFAERETLDPRAAAEERLLMGLRIDEGVAEAELGALPLARLPDLVEAGLLTRTGGRIIATAQGRLLLDRVTAELAR